MFDPAAIRAYCFSHADSIRQWVTVFLTEERFGQPSLQDLDAYVSAQMIVAILRGIAPLLEQDPLTIWQRITVTLMNEDERP